MKSILVYCGATESVSEIYRNATIEVANCLSKNNVSLVYGGGGVGLMGILSRKMIDNGSKVIGVIPHFLDKLEVGNNDISEMIKVSSMHERKAKMAELCDGIITLPGGFGSMDELFEILTWAQLGLHQKPIGILNVNGFYDFLLKQLDKMVEEGFLKPENRHLIIEDSEIGSLLVKMQNHRPIFHLKWFKTTEI